MSSFKTFQRKAGHMMGNAVQKGSDLMETGKTRLGIGKEERAVDELFYKIGEAVYENCKKNGVTPEYIAPACKEVDEHRARIEDLKSKLEDGQEDADAEEDKEVVIDISIDDKDEKQNETKAE
jgi:hypothetical protein